MNLKRESLGHNFSASPLAMGQRHIQLDAVFNVMITIDGVQVLLRVWGRVNLRVGQ